MAQTRRKLRARVPHGFELLYDSYNGVGIGYGATQSYSSPVVSLLAYPRWVTLFFLYGATLDDPHELLQGTGRRVRSIRVTSADVLDDPRVGALLEQALRRDRAAFAAAPKLRTYVQSIANVRKPRASGLTSTSAPQARSRSDGSQRSGRSAGGSGIARTYAVERLQVGVAQHLGGVRGHLVRGLPHFGRERLERIRARRDPQRLASPPFVAARSSNSRSARRARGPRAPGPRSRA